MSLLDSLGLDKVEGDPNNIPDNTYKGVVYKSEAIVTKDKTKVLHVIGYRVEEGQFKGAQRDEMFELGTNPQFDGPTNSLVGFTPSMQETQKPWYKKRWMDLGVPEEQVGKVDFGVLVGVPCDFGVKTNGAYKNISFARKRDVSGQTVTPVDPNAPASSITTNTAQPQPTPTGTDGPPF